VGGLVVDVLPESQQGDRLSFFVTGPRISQNYNSSTQWEPVITTPCGCPSPSPGPGFECQSGIWQSSGSIEVPSVTLPSGVQVVVIGNFSVGNLIFNGLGSTINVTGCANITQGITITVNPDEVSPGTKQQLIQQNGENCASLENLEITVLTQDPANCKQASASQDSESTPSSLTVLFAVDDSKCGGKNSNTRWIILGSVLGGVLVIAAVITLIFTLNPAAKNWIRPHRVRKGMQSI
jgi:hypothetical protein